MHSEIAESNPLQNKTPEVHDSCPNRRDASSHTSGPSAARPQGWTTMQYWKPKPADWQSPHGVRLVHSVDDLAHAMDQDRGGTLVLSHHESEVQEALRLIQADADFPASLAWLTTMHATWGFEQYIAQSGLFHARSKMPGVVGGKIVFKWSRVICSSKDSPWTRRWIDHDFPVLPTTRTRWRFHHRPSCSWLQTCRHLLEYMLSAPWSICTLMGARPCWC